MLMCSYAPECRFRVGPARGRRWPAELAVTAADTGGRPSVPRLLVTAVRSAAGVAGHGEDSVPGLPKSGHCLRPSLENCADEPSLSRDGTPGHDCWRGHV